MIESLFIPCGLINNQKGGHDYQMLLFFGEKYVNYPRILFSAPDSLEIGERVSHGKIMKTNSDYSCTFLVPEFTETMKSVVDSFYGQDFEILNNPFISRIEPVDSIVKVEKEVEILFDLDCINPTEGDSLLSYQWYVNGNVNEEVSSSLRMNLKPEDNVQFVKVMVTNHTGGTVMREWEIINEKTGKGFISNKKRKCGVHIKNRALYLNDDFTSKVSGEVYNVLGKKIGEFEIVHGGKIGTKLLNLKNIASGKLIIKLKYEQLNRVIYSILN